MRATMLPPDASDRTLPADKLRLRSAGGAVHTAAIPEGQSRVRPPREPGAPSPAGNRFRWKLSAKVPDDRPDDQDTGAAGAESRDSVDDSPALLPLNRATARHLECVRRAWKYERVRHHAGTIRVFRESARIRHTHALPVRLVPGSRPRRRAVLQLPARFPRAAPAPHP